MEKDEVLGQRLQAARDRQDRFLAGEVEKGAAPPVETQAPAEVVEQVFEPSNGEGVAEVVGDDLIPDVDDERDEDGLPPFPDLFYKDEEEPEAKRL